VTGPLRRLGDEGADIASLRARLADLGLIDRDGPSRRFDVDLERAVRAFQQQRGLTADGVVGPGTRAALADAAWVLGDRVLEHLPGALAGGDDVVALQRRLLDLGFAVGHVDGLYGAETAAGVAEFQRNLGLTADGVLGPETMTALSRLRPIVQGGNPNAMRAAELLREAGPRLDDKLVVLDVVPFSADVPGLTPGEASRLAHLGSTALERIATLVEGGLREVGARSTRTPDTSERERAWAANRSGGAVVVSLTADASADPEAGGLSTYFYGIDAHDVRSTAGERFAGLVHREVLARTRFADGGCHPRFWDLLRVTSMPAVRLDLGSVTHVPDAEQLQDPGVLAAVAQAVVVAVQRVYLTPEEDSPTGLLDLEALRRLREQQDPQDPPREV